MQVQLARELGLRDLVQPERADGLHVGELLVVYEAALEDVEHEVPVPYDAHSAGAANRAPVCGQARVAQLIVLAGPVGLAEAPLALLDSDLRGLVDADDQGVVLAPLLAFVGRHADRLRGVHGEDVALHHLAADVHPDALGLGLGVDIPLDLEWRFEVLLQKHVGGRADALDPVWDRRSPRLLGVDGH